MEIRNCIFCKNNESIKVMSIFKQLLMCLFDVVSRFLIFVILIIQNDYSQI